MRFSLFYNFDVLPGKQLPELYAEIEQQAIASDTLGFDTIWFAEHHFDLYGRMPNPLLFLARISGLTKNIRLGTAVVEAPHYHPLRLAEDSALLDVLSAGRLCLGIGSGAANKPAEFERFAVPIEQKGARTLEIVEILRQAFDEGEVNFTGTHYHFPPTSIQPPPLQPAHKLIWLAASKSTVEFAGRAGYPILLPRVGTSAHHRQLADTYQAALGDQPGFISCLRFVYIAETERAAQEETHQTIARYARYDLRTDWDGRTDTQEYREILSRLNAIVGTPEQVIQQLRTWQQETLFDEAMCQLYAAGMRHEDSLRSLNLLAREVIPVLQNELPSR
jgi:alkanesulfonate monooxygenase SsuD/methylene tetrahydromethanopterin reductase-like flavin-dependent oxidoreductase (luciferase family)